MVEFNSRQAAAQRRETILRYLERRQLYPFQVRTEPSDDLRLLVVIPCFDEPDINVTINSVARCDYPGCEVEALVVINGPEGMSAAARDNNLGVVQQITGWGAGPGRELAEWLRVFAIRHENLPVERAGVGLARKLGMDEAVARVGRTSQADGLIISLDADCEVASNYLVQINEKFSDHPGCPGMSIYYEHAVPGHHNNPLHAAIIDYELHLRCYVAGQRLARFPYAFHTVGSAMACRASSYAEQGGMNRRQGGEDFYFIQKLAALSGYRALNSTTVYPAARLSNRVPFGTGPAMQNLLNAAESQETFSPEVYAELQAFCRLVLDSPPDRLMSGTEYLPETLQAFLQQQEFPARLAEIQSNVASAANFRKRVFRWFNAFRFLKFAQFASRESHPKVPVADAALQIARMAGICEARDSASNTEWLEIYRRLDRHADSP